MLTLSGREVPDPPKIRTHSNRVFTNDVRKSRKWLLECAIDEARFRNDDYNLCQFLQEDYKNLPQASIEAMNVYVFGVEAIYLELA